jgi:hypothetical protein
MSMDVDEDEHIGKPLDAVPAQESTDERCMGKKKQKRDGEVVRDEDDNALFAGYCGSWPGKGTDHVGEGRCSRHGGMGGASEGNDNAEGNDGGAPEENTNAVTHALYVKSNKFYQEVIDDDLRALCDEIFEDYVSKFQEVNGEPVAGEKARLSEIAVNHIKIIHSDNWAVDRPADLHSGNALVDRETRVKTTEHDRHDEHRYKESVVIQAQQRLRKEDRKWLKDMGLLGADAVDVNVDGQVDHEHGVDKATEEIIKDLADDLKA